MAVGRSTPVSDIRGCLSRAALVAGGIVRPLGAPESWRQSIPVLCLGHGNGDTVPPSRQDWTSIDLLHGQDPWLCFTTTPFRLKNGWIDPLSSSDGPTFVHLPKKALLGFQPAFFRPTWFQSFCFDFDHWGAAA